MKEKLFINESKIEKYLTHKIKNDGGLCFKFVSPGHAGVPDRVCVHPNFGTFFVELKAPNEKPRVLQSLMHKRLEDVGARVYVIDSKEDVDKLMGLIHVRTALY